MPTETGPWGPSPAADSEVQSRRVSRWVMAVAALVLVGVVGFLGVVLWIMLGEYINPQTAPERKDLVQSFAIVVAGIVGSLSALAAVGNLYLSRRNLEQQRELEEQRAQDDTLRAYLDQMSTLVREHDLHSSTEGISANEISVEDSTARSLARVQTLSVLAVIDGHRKYRVLLFLAEAGLIFEENNIVQLVGADLSELKVKSSANLRWNLSKIVLHGTDLSGADLHNVFLRESILSNTDLSGADLSNADLIGADLTQAVLSGANLRGADLSDAEGMSNKELEQHAYSLEGTTMPNGRKYEDWLKNKDRGEDG